MKFKHTKLLLVALLASKLAYADPYVTVQMNMIGAKDNNKDIGTINIKDTPYGALFTPDLRGLTPGVHGFHVHVNPSCDNQGMAAGGHLDPAKTDKHLGPYSNKGHLGDLPVLIVDKYGRSTIPVLAPRLKLKDIVKHSLMIHEGGDNYSDTPKLGGGGARIACGVID